MLEALKAYEEAARLDPEAPAVYKAQVPLLMALDRGKAGGFLIIVSSQAESQRDFGREGGPDRGNRSTRMHLSCE